MRSGMKACIPVAVYNGRDQLFFMPLRLDYLVAEVSVMVSDEIRNCGVSVATHW